MNVTTASPVEIDTEIQRLEVELGRLGSQRASAVYSIRRAAGQRQDRHTGLWDGALDDAIAAVEAGTIVSYNQRSANSALTALRELDVEMATLRDQIAPLDAEYIRRGRWSRVYLVTNSNGHVHSHTRCRNCYASTSYYWVTELSGSTDAEVVAQAGGQSCLTCYDSVREQIDANRECRIEEPAKRQARADRAAAAKARAEKAAIKGITAPDGQPLVIHKRGHRYGETIKTARAAQIELVSLLWYAKHYGANSAEPEAVAALEAALAHKNGTTVEQEREAAQKRLADREKREARY